MSAKPYVVARKWRALWCGLLFGSLGIGEYGSGKRAVDGYTRTMWDADGTLRPWILVRHRLGRLLSCLSTALVPCSAWWVHSSQHTRQISCVLDGIRRGEPIPLFWGDASHLAHSCSEVATAQTRSPAVVVYTNVRAVSSLGLDDDVANSVDRSEDELAGAGETPITSASAFGHKPARAAASSSYSQSV